MLPTLRRLDARLNDAAEVTPPAWVTRAAATVAVACGVFMFSVALRMHGPTIHPDEFGFLTNGQVLLGRDEAPLPTGSFYPAGYGVVTAIGALVGGSISGAYTFAILTNFALAIVTAWVAHRLATRGFGASRATGVLAGLLVFVAPGTIVSAMFSWAETAARLAFLGFVYLVMRATASRRAPVLAAVGLYTGLMPALHGRFVLLLPIVCLVFAWWALRRDAAPAASAAGIAATTTGFAGSYLLNKFVKSAVYLQSYDQENRLLRRLFNPGVWDALARKMAGQIWYLVATSYGLVGVGVICAAAVAWRAARSGGARTDPRAMGFLVAVVGTMAVVFTGGLQLLYGDRGDHLIYGRYVEMMVPALLVLGCVAIERTPRMARRAWLASAALVLAISGLYVVADGGDALKFRYLGNKVVFPNIVGVDFVRYFVRPGMVTFGVVFSLAALAMWAVARRRGALAVVVLIAVFAAGSIYSGQRSILGRTADLEASGSTVGLVRGSGASEVGFDMGVRNDRSYYYLRFKLHPVRLVRFDISSPDAVIPEYYRCLYGWPDKPPHQGEWRVVADEPVLGRVLWQRVGSTGC